MKRKLFFVLLCILFLGFFTNVHAPIIPHEYTFDIPCYAPTRITFNYAYTHNHSIYDITTFGASLYKHSGGPTFYEFTAQDIDDYFFSLRLSYSKPTNQTILIGMWSGTNPMQGINLQSLYEEVTIHVRLRVHKEPTYPSEEDVARQVVTQVQKNLVEYYTSIQELVRIQSTVITVVAGLSVVTVAVVILVVFINVIELRRFRKQR